MRSAALSFARAPTPDKRSERGYIIRRMSGKQVVFGCSGPIGVALMERLAAAGHDVVGVCRSGISEAPDGVEIEAGDVRDTALAARLA